MYLGTVRLSLPCIEINLSQKTKNVSPIKAAITKQLVYSKSFNYFVWEDLWTISSNIVSFQAQVINTCILAPIFSVVLSRTAGLRTVAIVQT